MVRGYKKVGNRCSVLYAMCSLYIICFVLINDGGEAVNSVLTQYLFDFKPEEKKQTRRHVNAADQSVWRDEWPNENRNDVGRRCRRTNGREATE